MNSINDPILRRKKGSYPFCGRLIALRQLGTLKPLGVTNGTDQELSIDFPAQPDQLDLAREADYMVVESPIAPDGFHQYKATHYLQIPFSFRLHSFDTDFCDNGALSLLQLAARLHSFILPFSPTGSSEIAVKAGTPTTPTNTSNAQNNTAYTAQDQVAIGSLANVIFPVAVRLEFIFTEEDAPGVVCHGYLKSVRTRLLGPFMRGPGISRNLPSACDFEFTFVHAPGYGNNIRLGNTNQVSVQAYGDLVKKRLYNTGDISNSEGYTSFGDIPRDMKVVAPLIRMVF